MKTIKYWAEHSDPTTEKRVRIVIGMLTIGGMHSKSFTFFRLSMIYRSRWRALTALNLLLTRCSTWFFL
jgi:hypothetical protein